MVTHISNDTIPDGSFPEQLAPPFSDEFVTSLVRKEINKNQIIVNMSNTVGLLTGRYKITH